MDYQSQDKPERAFRYPKVAADILSQKCPAIKDFFSIRSEDGKLRNFGRLFEDLLQPDGIVKGEMINITRSNYIYKVIQSLIYQDSVLFVGEIFSNVN